jgi:metal-sulfur cluster biosynthetic enzyme
VTDPEYPLSIVELGLVYDARLAHGVAAVRMTLTSIGCPGIEMITDDVRAALRALAEVERVDIEIVWDPPWTKDRISPRGRRVLACYGVT